MKKIETDFWKEMLKLCEEIISLTENLFDWTKNDITLMRLHFNLHEFSFKNKASEPYGIWIPKHMIPFPTNYKAVKPVYEEDEQAAHWYVKCNSCNQYFPWSHPEHWYTMCEDCIW